MWPPRLRAKCVVLLIRNPEIAKTFHFHTNTIIYQSFKTVRGCKMH